MLRHPFSMIISGPSFVGKTSLVYNILRNCKNVVFDENDDFITFDAIIIIYKSFQPLYQEMQNNFNVPVYLFQNKLPTTLNTLLSEIGVIKPVLIVDDGLSAENQDLVLDLFTRLSHHLNISVILICQSVFDSHNPILRMCHRNAKYLIIFSCPRDMNMLRTLIYQMNTCRKKAQQILNILEDELSKPRGYILIDLHPMTQPALRYRTNILGENEPYPIILAFPDTI